MDMNRVNLRHIGLPHIGLAFIAGAVIALVAAWWMGPKRAVLSIPAAARQVVRIDTVLQVRQAPPVVIRTPARIERAGREIVTQVDTIRVESAGMEGADLVADSVRVDTVLRAEPFAARLDTVVNGRDSIWVALLFPPARWQIELRRTPDTLATVTIAERVRDGPAWYEWAGVIGGSATVGMLIGLVMAAR